MDVISKQEESVDSLLFPSDIAVFPNDTYFFQQRFSPSLLFKDFCILLRLRLTFNCFYLKAGNPFGMFNN